MACAAALALRHVAQTVVFSIRTTLSCACVLFTRWIRGSLSPWFVVHVSATPSLGIFAELLQLVQRLPELRRLNATSEVCAQATLSGLHAWKIQTLFDCHFGISIAVLVLTTR